VTINLDQAKKLHELGVRKKTQYCWIDEGKYFAPRLQLSIRCHGHPYAYSAEELVGMIKGDLEIVRSEEGTYYTFCQMKDSDGIEFCGQFRGKESNFCP
jgi:hypothetical protein